MRQLHAVTIVVPDYDLAISHYVGDLGFTLVCDTALTPTKRWVLVSPNGDGPNFLLAKADGEAQKDAIGQQAGGRVAFILHTDDFARDYQNYTQAGVKFEEDPRYETYGTVAVFNDMFGNRWDLIEPAQQS